MVKGRQNCENGWGLQLLVHAYHLDAHGIHEIMESHLHFLANYQGASGTKAMQFSFISHTCNMLEEGKIVEMVCGGLLICGWVGGWGWGLLFVVHTCQLDAHGFHVT